ncbi:MAG: tRNA pseudouridine(13) synthase TruD [Candidatus Bipolaricaulota bacterium]|nr:tRNA pseudouridine(13) synthase TruD [Candidatus Bipolaricaulota bacterium]MDW8126340.1 tRNA pseudouridine(13) synthase TruD [Candidatus Bipolaricaulota bacterium]
MRIKTIPEDFRVEELLKIAVCAEGPYAVFRVEKRNLTTLEAQVRLASALGVPPSAIHFPALKDKVAVAIQHCSIRARKRNFPDSVEIPGISAKLLGFSARHLVSQDLAGNKFTVTLRDIRTEEVRQITVRFEIVSKEGFPNYFDLQRFGSWSARFGFPGKLLLLGRWEEALRAYLAEPLAGDPPPVLRFKKIAREHWGDWKFLKERAPRGNLRSVLTFLCDHPQDFKRAVNLITPRVLSLWLSAYQSFLWNRVASRVLEKLVGKSQALAHLRFPWGTVAVPVYPLDLELQRELLDVSLPLPSAKSVRAGGEDPGSRALLAVLAEEGLELRDLRARGVERAYLPRGGRALWVVPSEPKAREPEPDELFPGRQKLSLSFSLPPGAYATLLLRLLERLKENLPKEETAD